MNDNVKDFLDGIQGLKEETFKVKQISTGKSINCHPLTFKQQKELIATIADGTLGVIRFQKIVNEILLENTENDTLLVTDKLPIILKLRSESIGKTVKIDDVEVDFNDNIKKSEKMKFTYSTVIDDKVLVNLKVPTLKDEKMVLQYTMDVIKKDGEKDAGKNITNIYTFEIVKFIESIKFGENELNFGDIPVRDRVKIVENLPLAINKKIVKYIEGVKEIENDVLKLVVGDDEKSIDIDVSFFDN